MTLHNPAFTLTLKHTLVHTARSLCWVDQLTFELALMPLLLARCWMSFRDIPSSSSRVHDMATLVLWLLCTLHEAST